MNSKSIGDRIKKERQRLGLTQTDLGKMINISKQTICGWETGRCTPDIFTLKKIPTLCGRSIVLFTDDEKTASTTTNLKEELNFFGTLTEKEKQLILKLRTMPLEKRKALEILLEIKDRK